MTDKTATLRHPLLPHTPITDKYLVDSSALQIVIICTIVGSYLLVHRILHLLAKFSAQNLQRHDLMVDALQMRKEYVEAMQKWTQVDEQSEDVNVDIM